MAKRKSSKMVEIDYEDEPDWDSLNVIPMNASSNRKYCSNVWEYFGQLMRSSTCLDNKNFYCLPCFQNHKLKQYSSTTATSNFYTHLRVFHNITPDRGTKKDKKNLNTTAASSINSSISIIANINDETTQHLNDLMADDPLSEMLVVRQNNNNSSSNIDIKKVKQSPEHNIENFIESPRFKPKPKFLHQQQQIQIQSSQKNYDNLVNKSIDEADYDKLFILSLVNEFRKVSDDYRLDAKSDLLGVLRKYQHLSRTNERIENQNINTEYETQNLQY